MRQRADDVLEVVHETAKSNPGSRLQRWAFARCGILSLDFACRLRADEIPHQVWCLRGWKRDVHETCHPDWRSIPKRWKHYVVLVEGRVYDFTARQFDKGAEWPQILSPEQVHERWHSVTVIGDAEYILNRIAEGYSW